MVPALEQDAAVGRPAFASMPGDELVRTEYYADFMRPQRLSLDPPILLLLDRVHGKPGGAIGVFPRVGSSELGPAEMDVVRELAPHLQRAIAVTRRVLELEGQVEALGTVFDELRVAMALLDGDGCVLRANSPFRALAHPGGSLRLRTDGVTLARSQDSQKLAASIRKATGRDSRATGSIVLIPRPPSTEAPGTSSDRELVAHVIPVAAGSQTAEWLGDRHCRVCLWVVDPEDRSGACVRLIQQILGLTPAESRVAESLARGLATHDLTRTLGITRNTARGYVKRILFKTGTHNRSERVRLLLSLDPPVRPSV